MDVTWLDPDHLDRRDVDGALAVIEAARAVDCPHERLTTTAMYVARLRYGWDGEPPEVAVVRDGGRRVLALVEVSLPRWDNTHLGFVEPTVAPDVRRRGLGRAVFGLGVEKVRAAGRAVVMADCFDLEPSLAFAEALGLERAMAEAKRRQDLRRLDWHHLDGLAAEAEKAARDYEVVRMPAVIPDDMMPSVLEMLAAINDAPTDDLKLEDEVFTPERHRAFRAAQDAAGRRLYQLAARHRDTGVLAGHTMTAVEAALPHRGHQFDTSVLAAHRGHRLGLLLKISMLRWLAEEEPQLHVLDTWNAVSNDHMISVNEAMGYELIATASVFQRSL